MIPSPLSGWYDSDHEISEIYQDLSSHVSRSMSQMCGWQDSGARVCQRSSPEVDRAVYLSGRGSMVDTILD